MGMAERLERRQHSVQRYVVLSNFQRLSAAEKQEEKCFVQAPKEKSLHEKLYDNYVHTLKAEDVKLVDETNKGLLNTRLATLG